jgi:hypothetical protein
LWQLILCIYAACPLENELSALHISGMAQGWNIIASRPDPNGGGILRARVLVRVIDKMGAIALVQSKMPGAEVFVESEASAEILERYLVNPGEVFVLAEGK